MTKESESLLWYIYITTNLLNGKQYVGDHSTNDLNDNYLGSGNCRNALKKHGKENFKKEILEFYTTKQEAFNAQEKYIIQYNILSPNGYNISPTGGVGCPSPFSPETLKKMRKKHAPMSQETKDKMSKARKGVKRPDLSIILKGHIVSEETRLKIAKSNDGKPSPIKGKKMGPISNEHKEKISKAQKGKSKPEFSKEHKENLSKSLKGRVLSDEHKKNIGLNAGTKDIEVRKRLSAAKKGKTWEDIYGIDGAKKRREK